MSERPYVVVSCAMSVDGYIDDAGPSRLILSSEEDLDRVDELRASADAIMVGAGTVRRDDPRLLVRSPVRRARRAAAGLPESPARVTVTASGDLPASAAFFTAGNSARLVYCARGGLGLAHSRLSGLAEIIDAGAAPSPARVLADLSERGFARVLLEGGGRLASSILAAGLADELHLVVAPLFVGDAAAPRFGVPGAYPHGPGRRMRLAEVRPLGDVVLLRYLLATERAGGAADSAAAGAWLRQTIERLGAEEPPGSQAALDALDAPPGGPAGAATGSPGAGNADVRWLRAAIELSRRCPPSRTAFSVGAVVVAADGAPLASGFSRERDLRDHAEEVALAKVQRGDPRLAGATIYTSLEPCGVRASRPRPCADLIISAGIARVVYAWREPPLLAAGGGAEMLRAAGVSVSEVLDLAPEARAVNAHLFDRSGHSG